MRFATRRIDEQKYPDGTRSDVYEILDGERVIGSKTVHWPKAARVVEIDYRLGEDIFHNPDEFMTAYFKDAA
jgi:hypothetical protein